MARDSRVKEKSLTVREELASIRGLFEGHVKSEGEWQAAVGEWQAAAKASDTRMEEKVDRILNVRINGTQGFENVIALLWDATAGARVRMKIRRAFAKWTQAHPSFNSIVVWAIKKVIWAFLTIFIIWLMYRLGYGHLIEMVLRVGATSN